MMKQKSRWIWVLGSLGIFAGAERLMQAARAADPSPAQQPDSASAAAAPSTANPSLSEIQDVVNTVDQQLSIDDALADLRARYGDEIVKRLHLKFDGEHLQVIGIDKVSPEMKTARQPTTE